MYYRKNGTPIIEEAFEKSMKTTDEEEEDGFFSTTMKFFILFVMISILIGLLYTCKKKTVDDTLVRFASALPI